MHAPSPPRPGRLTPLLLAILGLLLTGSQLLNRLDLWLYDGLSRSRLAHDDHAAITVIAVDEKSLAELGRWPWPRAYHAQLLDKLSQAKAVGLDIAIVEPSAQPEADQHLAAAIRRNGKVIGPVFPEMQGRRLVETRPLPLLSQAMAGLGHTDYEQDDDGIIRRVYLQAGLGGPRYLSFASALCQLASGGKPATPAAAPAGAAAWHRAQAVMVPFSSGNRPYQTVSYADALNRLPPASFAGRIVLIGATATGLGDSHPTPISANNRGLSGVEINAFMVHALLENLQITQLDTVWKGLLAGLILLLADWRLSRQRSPRRLLAHYALTALAMLLASAVALYLGRLWIGGGVTALLLLLAGMLRFVASLSRLHTLAMTDGLTGLHNRRHFDEAFAATLAAHQRQRRPLALLIVDLDNFKGYNDHYGHYAGDEVLQRTAGALRKCFRRKDETVARLGGEEFGILLANRRPEQALAAAERFRRYLEDLQLPHAASPLGKVTCSIGVAARPPADDTPRSLFEDADQALYLAKSEGRNRVCQAESGPAAPQASAP
ncbi:CHASE2 domain-containing protein [Chromobacterium subtsugae]|uniref:CHASE2 domain-containing protein n=1 Tax=Chromobacterium subtsugae TaxID=251747 RepID=UPI0013649C9D|nr:CHASE2 domain-containing protein [Chromobacterium subtsugae]